MQSSKTVARKQERGGQEKNERTMLLSMSFERTEDSTVVYMFVSSSTKAGTKKKDKTPASAPAFRLFFPLVSCFDWPLFSSNACHSVSLDEYIRALHLALFLPSSSQFLLVYQVLHTIRKSSMAGSRHPYKVILSAISPFLLFFANPCNSNSLCSISTRQWAHRPRSLPPPMSL